MTDVHTARLRVYGPQDFVPPAGWPEDVGIAALLGGGEPEIFPVHSSEEGACILARIEMLTGRDLRAAAIFPPVAGHPPCDMAFSAVAELRVGIESFLARTPDAVEEAADFSVNFGFAADEGLDPVALVRSALAPAEPPATDDDGDLPGYHRLDPSCAEQSRFLPALLWRAPSGELAIITDPDASPVQVSPADVRIRDDGMALAIRRSGLAGTTALPGYLLLPPDCLALEPPAAGAPILISTWERHHIATLVPLLEAVAPPPEVRPDQPLWSRGPAVAVRRPGNLLAVIFAAAVLSALVLLGDEPVKEAVAAEPAHLLRAELFP